MGQKFTLNDFGFLVRCSDVGQKFTFTDFVFLVRCSDVGQKFTFNDFVFLVRCQVQTLRAPSVARRVCQGYRRNCLCPQLYGTRGIA